MVDQLKPALLVVDSVQVMQVESLGLERQVALAKFVSPLLS